MQSKILSTFGKSQADGSTPRLVTLHGLGGMGKTRVAVSCGIQAAGMFKDGVFLIRLDDKLKSKESVSEAVSSALGWTGEAALPENLCVALRDKEYLLILDNYEAVACTATAEFLGDLLAKTRRLRLLVTGQEAVKLSAVEQIIPLDEGMAPEEAAQLFIARAQLKKGPGWQPAANEQDQLESILSLTDGIPLGVELAAAWTDKRSLKEIAIGIKSTPLMSQPPGGLPMVKRHISLTRCLDWSLSFLENWAQDGFARLSCFIDTFAADIAHIACSVSDAQGLLDRLQDASLVRRFEVGGYGRYTMHRITRAYAIGKLSSMSSASSIRQIFVDAYRKLAATNSDIREPAKLAVLKAELRNALAAADIAGQLSNWDAIIRLSESLGPFLDRSGLWAERESLTRSALDALRRYQGTLTGSPFKEKEGLILDDLGDTYAKMGRWTEAEEAYQDSLSVKRTHGSLTAQGVALDKLARVYLRQGRWGQAEKTCGHSLKTKLKEKRLQRDHRGLSFTLNNLGDIYRQRADGVKAERCYRRSLRIVEIIGERRSEGVTLNKLANLFETLGQLPVALKTYEKSLQIFRYGRARNAGREAQTLNGIGSVYRQQKRWPEAEAQFQKSLDIYQKLEDRRVEAITLSELGSLYRDQRNWPRAEVMYSQALVIHRTIGDALGEAIILDKFGRLYHEQEEWGKAEEAFRDSSTIFRSLKDAINQGKTLKNWARMRAAHTDKTGALQLARKALEVVELTEDDAGKEEARKLVATLE
jgi:predicted ATPase/uncharacterized protein HemY